MTHVISFTLSDADWEELLNQQSDFMQAISRNDLETVRLLVSDGSTDTKKPVQLNNTCIWYAVTDEMLELLLDLGADPHAHKKMGTAPHDTNLHDFYNRCEYFESQRGRPLQAVMERRFPHLYKSAATLAALEEERLEEMRRQDEEDEIQDQLCYSHMCAHTFCLKDQYVLGGYGLVAEDY
jgi:hypothetical protein